MDKDRVEGIAHQVKGAVKEAAGKVTGDAKLEAEGTAEKAAGKVQNAVGGVKDTLRDANEAVRRTGRMSTILLIILVLLLLGALPTWPYSGGWGYYPSGGLGLVLLIVIILVVTGRL